jgi:hypothetical protein
MKMIQKLISGFKIEKNTNLYKKLSVHQFKKMVPLGDFWINLFNKILDKNYSIIKSKKSAIIWLIFTLSVEFLHQVAFIIILWITIKSAMGHDYIAVLNWTSVNIIINLYPILAQRYNRIRIMKIFGITRKDINDFQV